MSDFVFFDAGFAATQIGVQPISVQAKVLFETWYGNCVSGVILRKSAGYDLMTKVASLGMKYAVKDEAMPVN